LDVAIDLTRIKAYLESKYNHQYATTSYNYIIKYVDCYSNPSKLLEIPTSIRSNVLKALIMLSKLKGEHETFKASLKQHGIKWYANDNFNTFLNMMINNNHDSLIDWIHQANTVLHDNEKLFLKFTLLSGLRKAEAIQSFNMIIQLSKDNKLSDYYDKELRCLCHFKYPNLFLRNTKNCYISAIDESLINEIANSKPVSYQAVRKRLTRKGLSLRIKELRSYYATYLRNNGIIAEYVDVYQGRINKSVFIQHYLKGNLKALSTQMIDRLRELEKLIL
jgi:hypothetical protein